MLRFGADTISNQQSIGHVAYEKPTLSIRSVVEFLKI